MLFQLCHLYCPHGQRPHILLLFLLAWELLSTGVGGKLWFIGGFEGVWASSKNDVYSSLDGGMSWSIVLTAPTMFPPRGFHASAVFAGLLWVIAGWGPDVDRYYNDAWCTSDGTNWNAATTNAAFSGRHTNAVTLNGSLWIVAGHSPNGMLNEIWSSRNGAQWIQTSVSGNIFSRREHPGVGFFRDRIWVIGGQSSLNDVWASTDSSATSWMQLVPNAPFGGRWAHVVLAFNHRLLVIGGVSYPTIYRDVWSTADGQTWSLVTNDAMFPSRGWFACDALDSGIVVVAGGGCDDNGRGPYYADVWTLKGQLVHLWSV